jgi:DNA-binding IscR family transcriptional regulator
VLDGPGLFETCVLGLPGCGTEKPCPLHNRWREVRGGIHAVLADTSVTELLENPPALEARSFFA